MIGLVTHKSEEDPSKNKGTRVESYRNSNLFKLLLLVLLPTTIQEWSQHFSHYKSIGIFPDPQGQLTPKSLIGYCGISNSSKILQLSLLSARIKKSQSKMKELEWSQDFPHYNPMGAIICCHENQSFDQILGTSVATNVGFCHLLITYARSLDLDQDRQNIILIWIQTVLIVFLKELFAKNEL